MSGRGGGFKGGRRGRGGGKGGSRGYGGNRGEGGGEKGAPSNRPPAHLKGKQIGLWYAAQQGKNKQKQNLVSSLKQGKEQSSVYEII